MVLGYADTNADLIRSLTKLHEARIDPRVSGLTERERGERETSVVVNNFPPACSLYVFIYMCVLCMYIHK